MQRLWLPLIPVAHSLRGEGFDASEDGTVRGTPIVPVAFDTTQITSPGNVSNPQPGGPCHPLAAGAHPPMLAFHGAQDPDVSGDVTHPLGRNHGAECCIAYQCQGSNVGPMGTLRAGNGNEAGGVPFVPTPTAVRRLTPLECERLMGFPDNYTSITYGRPRNPDQICPDGPRYKALGNSMAVNVMSFIGRRIEAVENVLKSGGAS